MNNNEIFENVKMKIAISNMKEKDMKTNENKPKFKKLIGIAAACIIVSISGVAVATNYNRIINYFGLGKGVDSAIENGYIENPNMNYISSQSTLESASNATILSDLEVNTKIDDFLMDDLNLSVNFNLRFDEKLNIDNVESIELQDLIVTDEENRIICCMATKEVFDEYCKENNLPYVYGEFNENYINNGLNSFIKYRNSTNNQINLIYNIYADQFPRSQKLKFSFSKILLKEFYNEEEKNTILTGSWEINVNVPETMYNRQNVTYKVTSCSNQNFNITTAFASDTGFEIGIIISEVPKPQNYLQVLNEQIEQELSEGKITESEVEERKDTLLRTSKYQELIDQYYPMEDTPLAESDKTNIEETSYIENENGEKFEKSLSPSRRQDANFIEGNKFSYYETFELTKYELTNKLKLQLIFKGEPVIIELEKIN